MYECLVGLPARRLVITRYHHVRMSRWTARPPFVPNLKSITGIYVVFSDRRCSQVPAQINSTLDGSINPHKELSFVGYTNRRWETIGNQL